MKKKMIVVIAEAYRRMIAGAAAGPENRREHLENGIKRERFWCHEFT
ncbi:MAG: hypothetical protein V2A34_11390 [Lentisphaerota bacterium]